MNEPSLFAVTSLSSSTFLPYSETPRSFTPTFAVTIYVRHHHRESGVVLSHPQESSNNGGDFIPSTNPWGRGAAILVTISLWPCHQDSSLLSCIHTLTLGNSLLRIRLSYGPSRILHHDPICFHTSKFKLSRQRHCWLEQGARNTRHKFPVSYLFVPHQASKRLQLCSVPFFLGPGLPVDPFTSQTNSSIPPADGSQTVTWTRRRPGCVGCFSVPVPGATTPLHHPPPLPPHQNPGSSNRPSRRPRHLSTSLQVLVPTSGWKRPV
ncbi:hypothetical protein N658DRAFT_543862 [Parathielavia hyrcaniae]|uniref:Uncharacterized protein n=1 Tax=Parathielavia hyrcaniae TaxID=113614 RepID=A0AAN6SZL8_9PEZI|nr:hypothetical protein N658DRAFT_543862 [Parathielavia hyrcaniae]